MRLVILPLASAAGAGPPYLRQPLDALPPLLLLAGPFLVLLLSLQPGMQLGGAASGTTCCYQASRSWAVTCLHGLTNFALGLLKPSLTPIAAVHQARMHVRVGQGRVGVQHTTEHSGGSPACACGGMWPSSVEQHKGAHLWKKGGTGLLKLVWCGGEKHAQSNAVWIASRHLCR